MPTRCFGLEEASSFPDCLSHRRDQQILRFGRATGSIDRHNLVLVCGAVGENFFKGKRCLAHLWLMPDLAGFRVVAPYFVADDRLIPRISGLPMQLGCPLLPTHFLAGCGIARSAERLCRVLEVVGFTSLDCPGQLFDLPPVGDAEGVGFDLSGKKVLLQLAGSRVCINMPGPDDGGVNTGRT